MTSAIITATDARKIAHLVDNIHLARTFFRHPSNPEQYHRWQRIWAESMVELADDYGIELFNLELAREVQS